MLASVLVAVVLLSNGEMPAEAEVVCPQRGEIKQSASVFGRIRPVKEVKISPDVSGEIVEICVEEGDTVQKGDLLIKIRQESYLLSIARCRASLGSATRARDAQRAEVRLKELEYNRLQQLCESDAAPAAKKEQARLELEAAFARAMECECQIAAAQASLRAARSELEKTLVYAPISGTVTHIGVKGGERVVGTATMAGTEMMTISDLQQMELVVKVGEHDIGSISAGDKARIKADAFPAETIAGHVSKMALKAYGGDLNGATTDFEVRLGIDSCGTARLLPGMSASAVISTGSKNDILTVPLQAVVIRDGSETLWVVDPQQRVHLRKVSCGIQDFSRIEITGGVEPDERIVSGPYQLITKTLAEGDKIRIKDGPK